MSRLLHHLFNSFVTVVPRKHLQAYSAYSAASQTVPNPRQADSTQPFGLAGRQGPAGGASGYVAIPVDIKCQFREGANLGSNHEVTLPFWLTRK
jgi:hypothetical protein